MKHKMPPQNGNGTIAVATQLFLSISQAKSKLCWVSEQKGSKEEAKPRIKCALFVGVISFEELKILHKEPLIMHL